MNLVRMALALAVLVWLSGCGPKIAKTKPNESDLHGTYEAELEDGRISVLTISPNGSVTGSLLPVSRMESDGIDFQSIQSSWELIDPSMTPSGSWCVEFEGLFFRVYSDGSDLILRHPYDVLNHKTATYTRARPYQVGALNPIPVSS
jgi:hypothetical protein